MRFETPCLLVLFILLKTDSTSCVPSIIGPSDIQIQENYLPGTMIGFLSITGISGTDTILVPANDDTLSLVTLKAVNTTTYSIVLYRVLDREVAYVHTLTFRAVDKSRNTVASKSLHLHVIDVNDNVPYFTRSRYNFSVQENQQNVVVGQVNANDADAGQNGQIRYSLMIKSPHKGDFLQIDSLTGVITLKHPLDYESTPTLTYTLLAKDLGTPQLTSTAEVWISVEDVPDEPLIFIQSFYSATVREEAPIMTWLLTVSAVDSNSGHSNEIRYNIRKDNCGELFSSDSKTGGIYTRVVLDRESKLIKQNSGVCLLTVTAYEVHGNNTSDATVRIEITGLDEFPPMFTEQKYMFGLEQNATVNTVLALLGSDGIRVTDQDEGEGGTVSLSVQYPNGSSVPGLDVLTTGLSGSRVSHLVLTNASFLDILKQNAGEANVLIVAESSPFKKSSATARIIMYEVNKQPCFSKDTIITRPTTDPTNTCQHGGVYVDTDGSVHCYCAPGYVGKHCELDLDECMYNPCENNGTCINTVGSYSCACTDKQTGPHCSVSDCHDTVGFPCWIMVVFKMCDDVKIASECGKSCNRCPQPGGQQGSVLVG